jgi:hypothetical protein
LPGRRLRAGLTRLRLGAGLSKFRLTRLLLRGRIGADEQRQQRKRSQRDAPEQRRPGCLLGGRARRGT